MGEHLTGMLYQEAQQLVFPRRELSPILTIATPHELISFFSSCAFLATARHFLAGPRRFHMELLWHFGRSIFHDPRSAPVCPLGIKRGLGAAMKKVLCAGVACL